MTIAGSNRSTTERAIQTLDNLPFNFFLTGSRFFGNAHSLSDYDFFCQDSINVRKALTDVGFVRHDPSFDEGNYPEDEQICLVLSKGNVQVQLMKDAVKKCVAQNKLNQYPVKTAYLTTPKNSRHDWWVWAYIQEENDVIPEETPKRK